MGEEGERMGEREKGKGAVPVLVLDTPERSKSNQITAPANKFEDSPVFNFLNNLSPIKPVKSIHISQTINPLSFVSLPTVFTSPHVSSLKGSRFLKRHVLSDPSKPEFSSDEGNPTQPDKEILDAAIRLDVQQENIDPGGSITNMGVEQPYETSTLALAENFKYNCSTPSCGLRAKYMPEFASTCTTLVPFVEDASGRSLYECEMDVEGSSQIDQNKEASECDWDSLIDDGPDILNFESPGNAEAYKSVDPGTSFYDSVDNGLENTHSVVEMASHEQVGEGSETENPFTQPGEGSELKGIAKAHEIIGGSSMSNNPGERLDNEAVCGLFRGMRRRCLVFEMAGVRIKNLDQNSASGSSDLQQAADGNTSAGNKQLARASSANDSSRRALPGIGLHLNALATNPKDYKFVKHEASVSGKLLIGPGTTSDFHPMSTGQELLSNSSAVTSSEREIPHGEDAFQASGYMVNEETNQSSPKKKRRRLEQAGEIEGCKRCNCKKSKCLKLYCECFAAGVYCVEPCACIDCFNKPVHEDTVLATRKQIESRNPLAFAPKVIRTSDSLSEIGDDSSKTPASARHKRGCNCKKSGCLKKYCECYQGGVGCSINCRCEGCKNAFGRKDGSGLTGIEVDFDEEESDVNEKSVKDRSIQKTAIQKDLEHNLDSVHPATPLLAGRQLVQHPISSKRKPPRSSFPSIGSSSGLYTTTQMLGKSSFFPPPPRFDKHCKVVREEEMPEFLQTGSPISGIKSSSPNSKRVSPPHSVGMSPGLRSSRKLILQSIPSFPSLTPKD